MRTKSQIALCYFIIITDKRDREDYLHVRGVEVHLAEFEYHHVVPILTDRYVVAKGIVMIALCLVQDLVQDVDTSYDQLFTVVGRGADLAQQRIAGVAYAVAVRVRFAARVNRIDHLVAV